MRNGQEGVSIRPLLARRWLVVSLMVVALTAMSAIAGTGSRNRVIQAPSIDREAIGTSERGASGELNAQNSLSSINWVIVDSMANAFGPANLGSRPISYDSALNIVSVIHRAHLSYGTASGQLWYNLSRNGGTTWRRVGELNASSELNTRYPSGTIHNPTNSTDSSNALFAWAAPLLAVGGSGFGRMEYGLDAPLGSAAVTISFQEGDVDFWSSLPIWSGGQWLYWACYRGTAGTSPNDFMLWRTIDYTSVPSGVPPTWQATSWVTGDFHLNITGAYRNGVSYFGVWGGFDGDPGDVDNIGYSKSTDNGATWSTWIKPGPGDWRGVPGIAGTPFLKWFSFGPIGGGQNFEMMVDANNRVHFFGVAQDSVTLDRAVIEIYETATGWSGKIIQPDLKESTALTYGALNQTGHQLAVSTNKSGTVISLAWLDAATQGETIPDVWESHRSIGGNWSTPQNLTQTPTLAELLLHCAPVLRTNGGNSYTMFLGRTYQIGSPPYPPDDTQPSYFYVGTNTFAQDPVAVEEGSSVPTAYRLEQNYPNPFNPSTRIVYELPVSSQVNLAVYNLLGKQVATLFDGFKEAGTYDVEFSGSNLASGVYFYTLKAGQFVGTKKLLLVK